MPVYNAPLRDMQFVLYEVMDYNTTIASLEAFATMTQDMVDAVLEEAANINETLLFPLNQTGSEQGCRFNDGEVVTPDGFKQAFKTFAETGWTALAGEPEYGGQGFPQSVNVLFEEMLCSSNLSFSLYPGLTHGVCRAIEAHANDDLKQTYLPPMIAGQWTGVMCLTEPHCGTDLGLLRTKAEPKDDGSYLITGTKIFITAGEHDLTDNIVHLVLARTPDAPAGVKGISLFLVSKFLVNQNGELGDRNGVSCGSIEHKMGITASSTCVMNYDQAQGYLVGELNRGLAAMFTVMNIERLAIGLQGLGLSEVSYQNARDYARERLQGRSLAGPRYPDKAADPLLVHPDIRRMLLNMRSFNEGARAFANWVARHVDWAQAHPEAEQRQHSEAMLALFTPVIKAYVTDMGFLTCNDGLQVLGGHGYVKEWGMEQYVRDARIAQIYEGANGIQALDLVRRKLVGDKGETLKLFTQEYKQYLMDHKADINNYFDQLNQSIDQLEQATQYILAKAQVEPLEIGAASTDYLHLLSLNAMAYMWAQMYCVAKTKQGEFYETKCQVADYFFQKVLPKTASLLAMIETGASSLMQIPDDAF